jgi:hypothetical protein
MLRCGENIMNIEGIRTDSGSFKISAIFFDLK